MSTLLLVTFNLNRILSKQSTTFGKFFRQNELLLQDGLFIDFLQKQTLEVWLRQYILTTGCVFSERLLFEALIKFYFSYILWPLKNYLHFETSNVSDMLTTTFYVLCTLLTFTIFLFTI